MDLPEQIKRYWRSFSYVGLVFATLFFAVSVAPSLLPRPYFVQGLLSGFAIAIGYGLGNLTAWLWIWLELPRPSGQTLVHAKRIATGGSAVVFSLFLWRVTEWQNSVRNLMGMAPIETAYPFRMVLIAIVFAAVLITTVRWIRRFNAFVHGKLTRVMPRRVALAFSMSVVGFALLLLVNDVFVKNLLTAADRVFLRLDRIADDGVEQPADPSVTGSADSLISWDVIGRLGKSFIVGGPTAAEIRQFTGKPAVRPIRVYVGLRAQESPEQRAKLALEELKRVGAFERKLLIVATPTGTGWLDEGAVDTVEYLHGGDTAIVSLQYSYLPSWITILIDPNRSRVAAHALFTEVYAHWKTLPKDARPKLYLQGLSLGSFGSEVSAKLFTIFEDPIQGALWSGPPFPSSGSTSATANRNPDSPAWLPTFGDGSILRFTNQDNTLDEPDRRWGPIRCVYIQYASDPMVFFSPSLLWQRPEWLQGERGPDVSPYLDWYPIVTFLQIAFDLPMATSVPIGYGHNYSPENYIEGWVAVTAPEGWTSAEIKRLQQHFAPSR
ncbi:MAG: alpha/beta-hydrolase family protein [Planctomycetota bacterium]